MKRAGNNLLLLVYALVLNFPNLLYPRQALLQEEDHYLYVGFVSFFNSLGAGEVFYSLMAFLLLLVQAFFLNRIANNYKMFPQMNFLPAMSYILITSFFHEWSQFSAPLLANTLLIWIFYLTARLYNTHTPIGAVFNIGVLSGLSTLFYEPAIAFLLLIPIGLYVMRPFRVREWLISFFGFTIPYYFLVIYLYMADKFSMNDFLPRISFDLPEIPQNLDVTVAIMLIVIPFIIGGFLVQMNLHKMLIQVRKVWSLMLLMLIISLLVIFVSGGNNYVNWICAIISFSVFHAAAYYFSKGPWIASAIHWISFVFAMYINYSVFVD